ncbi:MAG TPA: hypothetical protein VJ417_12540 [Candidatus Glassbacteria bacterium]|nr:hypothetical protein [Candidatus Glassbacteria bacterium]
MDRESLTTALVQVLTSDEKWQAEVERSVMLQKTIDDLFNDSVFQVLLEHGALPKFMDTNIPHFRAIELICSLRELVHQLEEGAADQASILRDLEDFEFQINDKWGTTPNLELNLTEQAAVAEASRLANLYKNEPQFSARVERFRLLAVPLSAGNESNRSYQVVLLENIRPPRSTWKRQRK